MHTSIATELAETADANAVLATREIAAWLRTLPPTPLAPAELAARIEAEFIRAEPPAGETDR